MSVSWLYTIALTIGLTHVAVAQSPATIGSFAAGNALAQLNKAISKSYVESRNFTNTLPKAILQAEATLLLNELTKKCITSILPHTVTAAADLGMKSVIALDLYQAIVDAQKVFPTYGTPTLPAPLEPFKYSPATIERPLYGIPSSTSVDALTHLEQQHFTPKATTTFNLGLMHSIAGFGTALIGKIVVTRLVEQGVDPKKNALIFKGIMTATTIAFSQWFNELLKILIVDAPTSPQEELRFYDKMCSLGTRLFVTIDKTIAALPSTPTPAPLTIS